MTDHLNPAVQAMHDRIDRVAGMEPGPGRDALAARIWRDVRRADDGIALAQRAIRARLPWRMPEGVVTLRALYPLIRARAEFLGVDILSREVP